MGKPVENGLRHAWAMGKQKKHVQLNLLTTVATKYRRERCSGQREYEIGEGISFYFKV